MTTLISDIDPCKDFEKNCGYACDPTNNVCLCPIGYELDEDQQNCKGKGCLLYVWASFEKSKQFWIRFFDLIQPYLLFDITDVNECKLSHVPCKQECRNTNGSFQCYCRPGYMLKEDNISCSGIVFLIYFFCVTRKIYLPA